MSYGCRFGAWMMEMLVEALSFYCVISLMSHADEPTTARDIVAFTIETLTFFGVSGYAITTLVISLFLRGKWTPVYPILAAVLFLIHFQIMNLLVPGGLLDPHNRFVFRIIGFGTVLVIAASISLILKHRGRLHAI